MLTITIQHQLDQKSRDLITQQVTAIVASQNAALMQKVTALMSVLDDKIFAVQTEIAALNGSVSAVAAEVATLKSASAEPSADQLAALDALATGVAGAKASLDALLPGQVVEPTPSEQPQA